MQPARQRPTGTRRSYSTTATPKERTPARAAVRPAARGGGWHQPTTKTRFPPARQQSTTGAPQRHEPTPAVAKRTPARGAPIATPDGPTLADQPTISPSRDPRPACPMRHPLLFSISASESPSEFTPPKLPQHLVLLDVPPSEKPPELPSESRSLSEILGANRRLGAAAAPKSR